MDKANKDIKATCGVSMPEEDNEKDWESERRKAEADFIEQYDNCYCLDENGNFKYCKP